MSNVRTNSGMAPISSAPGGIFVPLLVVTLVSTFVLIIIGGIVRVTDSGLGCPGWPLCYGKVVPPMEKHAIIEYMHRLFASIVSVLLLAVAGMAWAYYRRTNKTIFYLAISLILLLILQIALGAITVEAELASEFVTAHLATAETLFAVLGFLTTYAVLARRGQPPSKPNVSLQKWTLVTGIATFVLLMTGSFMVGSDSTAACSGWPLCNGGLFDGGYHQAAALIHRYTAAIVGVVTLIIGVAILRSKDSLPAQRLLAAVLVFLFVFQVIVGAMTVFSDYNEFFQSFHLTVASAVWIMLVLLASHQYLSTRKLPQL